MQHRIQRSLDIDIVCHIVLDELKTLVPSQVGDVVGGTGAEVVHGDHLVPLLQQVVTQVGANKACSASDQNPHDSPLL